MTNLLQCPGSSLYNTTSQLVWLQLAQMAPTDVIAASEKVNRTWGNSSVDDPLCWDQNFGIKRYIQMALEYCACLRGLPSPQTNARITLFQDRLTSWKSIADKYQFLPSWWLTSEFMLVSNRGKADSFVVSQWSSSDRTIKIDRLIIPLEDPMGYLIEYSSNDKLRVTLAIGPQGPSATVGDTVRSLTVIRWPLIGPSELAELFSRSYVSL